jgi:hypothetical protein
MTTAVLLMSRQDDRLKAVRWIAKAPDDYCVRFGKTTRTDKQNRKLWPMLQDIQQQVPGMATYSTEDIKNRFMNALGVEMRFLPVLEGEGSFPVGMKSSTLTKAQFAGLLELLYAFGAKHEVKWTDPETQGAAA